MNTTSLSGSAGRLNPECISCDLILELGADVRTPDPIGGLRQGSVPIQSEYVTEITGIDICERPAGNR
jgi:hypothetical protein